MPTANVVIGQKEVPKSLRERHPVELPVASSDMKEHRCSRRVVIYAATVTDETGKAKQIPGSHEMLPWEIG
jgi:hypothetical protein